MYRGDVITRTIITLVFVRVLKAVQYTNDLGRSSCLFNRDFSGERPPDLRCASGLPSPIRSCIEGRSIRERFSPGFSFAYRERGNTRTIIARVFVRVSKAMRNTNGFPTQSLGRAGSEASASGHHRLSCGAFSGQNLGSVRFRFRGRKRGLFGHEIGDLCDSPGSYGFLFRSCNALSRHHGSPIRRSPSSGTYFPFESGAGKQVTILTREALSYRARFDFRNGRKSCLGQSTAFVRAKEAREKGKGKKGEKGGREGRKGKGPKMAKRKSPRLLVVG